MRPFCCIFKYKNQTTIKVVLAFRYIYTDFNGLLYKSYQNCKNLSTEFKSLVKIPSEVQSQQLGRVRTKQLPVPRCGFDPRCYRLARDRKHLGASSRCHHELPLKEEENRNMKRTRGMLARINFFLFTARLVLFVFPTLKI